jgi:enamine deaminase RidA (YjgF/YER057c/UK114 family)
MPAPVQLINPPSLHDFTSHNFSNAAVIDTPARLVFTSGQVALDKDGHTPAAFSEQARLVFKNIKICLEQAGASVRNLVMVTMFCTNFSIEDTPLWEPYEEFLSDEDGTFRPPCMIIPVHQLASPQWHLEVSVQAAIPANPVAGKL